MPTTPPCWPNDPNWNQGKTEVDLPPSGLLAAYWDTEILDVNGVDPGTILSVSDAFQVRFRLELQGGAWVCMAGEWRFNVHFDQLGGQLDYLLSDRIGPAQLTYANWKGCDTQCIELVVNVPAGTIDAAYYEVGATFQLYCCGRPAAVVGYESLGNYLWYAP